LLGLLAQQALLLDALAFGFGALTLSLDASLCLLGAMYCLGCPRALTVLS